MALWTRRFTSWSRLSARMRLNSDGVPDMFLPPTDHSMRVLDKSFFKKTIHLSAATIFEDRNLSRVRVELEKSGDVLSLNPIKPVRADETVPGRKCMLLRPEIDSRDPNTWSPSITRLVEEKIAGLRPYELTMTYDDWTMHNILEAILPELAEDEKETPGGFSQIGHVAHINLRDQYLPYKSLIGHVLLDKNQKAGIRTVINKTEDVGTESVYRTFPYEVLAGPDDMDVTVSESDCEFKFNFGKVYWNTRLNTEHSRVINKFKEGETVCDVMAGVGPFAIPAGKRRVFVWANDLNPDSFEGLTWAAKRNKVEDFVRPSCSDGRAFIRSATQLLPTGRRKVTILPKKTKGPPKDGKQRPGVPVAAEAVERTLEEPATFDHYVMNLPASAVEFLDAFRGTHVGRERNFQPHTERRLPMVHVYCFSPKMETEEEEYKAVCDLVSRHLGHPITIDIPDVEILYVRLISPKKKMFCASFRLPPEVAFFK